MGKSKKQAPIHRKLSLSPASTGSGETTIAHGAASASSRSKSSASVTTSVKSKGSADEPDSIMAILGDRLRMIAIVKPNAITDDKDAKELKMTVDKKDTGNKSEVSVQSKGLILVKAVKCETDLPIPDAGFKQGRKVKCSNEKCQKEDSWRNMKNEKVWIDNDEVMYWKYTCVECHMKDTGMTHSQAVADLRNSRPDNLKRKFRVEAFTNARARVQENFPTMTNKQEVRTLTRKTFVEMFEPFAKIFELKIRHMEMNKGLWEEYELLVSMMKVCTSAVESEVLMASIHAHEKKMEATELPLAFQSKCEPGSDEHWRYMQAAQYSDEWICNKSPTTGQVVSAFRSFYICLAGGADAICYTVIPSKKWSTKHADPLASKQTWYCICCGAGYKTKFGMIIEIEIRNIFYYVRAQIPPDNLEDTRALYLEETLKPSSPEDLLSKLSNVTPYKSEILRPITKSDVWGSSKTKYDPDAFKIDATAFKKLQEFDWQQIMNFSQGKMDV